MPDLNPLELHRAYKRLFECADGRTVMTDLEQRGCFLRSSFSTSEPSLQGNVSSSAQ